MFSKRIALACLASSVALTPATRVAADGGDIVGGIIGGVVAGAIISESQNNRNNNTSSSGTVNTAARAQLRETQVSLNYFGFPAGTPDGLMGGNTRNAMADYQAFMGYPVTGQLTEYERQFLVSSYHRAQTGGAATNQLIAQHGGTRGLLIAYRDEAAGVSTMNASSNSKSGGLSPLGGDEAMGASATPSEETDPDSGQLALLPNLMGDDHNGPSLASHCNQVSLVTNSNGGFVTQASMNDPEFALSEQFCIARTYAIAEGEHLAGNLQGITNAQLEAQCEAFGPAMAQYVASLSLKPSTEVMEDVSGFVLETGMTPTQLAGTSKICLSVGYRTDNMDVAVGSALLLTVLGQQVYAELLGHHLINGFGTTARPDLALAWYETAYEAHDNGAQAVFAPGSAERNDLIISAAYQMNGLEDSSAQGDMGVQPASTLPTFTLEPTEPATSTKTQN